ncbi:serine O-acetyltransferase EpsC [Xanthobacter oligotrophicus]|uniref:serine O-acetyltransferase EpsC n=1 Tax=Xanthobacter oligotrophicus TaxID=2607286 RepID=UPI001AEE27CB|nr:serine O-acetyltransferase EpsC [Xanthobacter oligotrophicus]MCG5237498.1 serine acetyltransferase [Xanthobacter oligotrophicus]
MTALETPLQKIKADLRHYASSERRGVSIAFVFRMFLLTPGFQFVFANRLQEIVIRIPVVGRLLRRIIWWATCLIFSSEIALAAKVGGGLYVPHPYGIVVGSATIGRNLSLLQNVTIGHKNLDDLYDPVIEDDVQISAGAVLLGPITIGEGAVIGANSVVLKDVPAGGLAIGIPARIIPAAAPSVATEGDPLVASAL